MDSSFSFNGKLLPNRTEEEEEDVGDWKEEEE